MPVKRDAKSLKELYLAVASLENPAEVQQFLVDLCTPAELTAMADRWRVARLLERGVPYRAIYERTGVSTATVTRVARALSQGEGGYGIALARLNRGAKEEAE